ncbi:Tripartite tricarboxylate transporter TctB family protein [Palleronia marisminoris]|uniref:Tripartite tricarboxylate transporter TctB family protein n=1 Tax=Palleronia marisminoris TaxID=315423 RepID=A0A1Y5TRP3_9RHOB|nr:tripartite tricarboxylate transporter TctB family protein [Palleronia marisminoris]SFH47060.1 Tripartite tricarboxylate transporter TctB family protein [Palleronia marisminoris]SLN68485.1 Tripartite tricarboxylate transporter TctB family protein [Palleronia marisminoris]
MNITIDFETSHLVFPTVIGVILAILGLAILVRDRRRIAAAGSYWRETLGWMDKKRFFGTLVLTLIYFSLMVPVGNFWPNTGYGFLFCSVPFVFLSGLLFMHDWTLRGIIPLAIVAVVGPTFVWWLFTYPLFLTLP